MEYGRDGDTSCNRNNPQRFSKETGRFRNRKTSRDHPDYSLVMIGQNTEKSWRLAVTQTPEKDHYLVLV